MNTDKVVYMMKRSCLSKKRYKSLDLAKQWVRKFDKWFGNHSYIYYCPLCGYYHLTTHKQEGVQYLN